jgi:hypothetical protein
MIKSLYIYFEINNKHHIKNNLNKKITLTF